MSASSLIVRISADLTSFSRDLKRMTKDVREAAGQIADVGKTMTLGITLPVVGAGLALSKFAMENEALAAKMTQSFGPAADKMNAQLTEMMKLVPETNSDLQRMAVGVNDFAKGLGMAGSKSALFSQELMRMAANISASKDIGMAQALDAVEKGMMGSTRGLKSLGIVIDEAQIKQEAYRLKLLATGETLTPLGTALATYSLMVKNAAQFENEATRVHKDAATQWRFLKRDVMEFADATSNLVLPALRALIQIGRSVVSALNAIPDVVKEFIMVVGVMAATIGPTIVIVAKLAESFMVLKTAMNLLAEGSALKGLIAGIAAPEVLAALAVLAAALTAAIALWKKYHKEADEPVATQDPFADVRALLGGLTGVASGDPLSNLKKDVGELVTAFDRAVATGNDFSGILKQLKDTKYQLSGKLVELSAANDGTAAARATLNVYQQMYDQINKIIVLQYAMNTPKLLGMASKAMKSDQQIQLDLVGQAVNEDVALRVREAAVNMADIFDATRIATLEMRETFRAARQDFSKAFASFKAQWSDLGGSTFAGIKVGLTGVLTQFGPLALAAQAVGKVMEGLGPVLDAVFEPLVELGKILGVMLTPYLKLFFQVLKVVVIAVSYLGEILARVSAGIATGIGKLLVGIGNLINKLPGSPGNGIKAAGEAMLSFAKDQYTAADQMKRMRKELGAMSFDDAADGVKALGDAAMRTAEELTGLPEVFKYQLAKFNAIDPITMDRPPIYVVPPPPPTHRDSSNDGGDGETSGDAGDPALSKRRSAGAMLPDSTPVANINLDGRKVAEVTIGHLRSAAARQLGDPNRILDLVAI